MSVLSDKQLQEVCQGISGNCAYLMFGADGPECAKTDPPIAAVIATRLAARQMRATADNCSGPPKFEPKFSFPAIKND